MSVLRLLSFNIHGGRSRDGKRDLGRIHALLEDYDIDIGVFQEMETRSARGGAAADVALLAGNGRPYCFTGPNMKDGQEGWYGNLVVSRYPISRGLNHNLGTRPQYEPRGAIDALVETPLGALRVVGTHLSLQPVERWREARKLIELMGTVEAQEKNPVLLMGDINEWQRPSKLLRFLDRVMTPVPCRATFPSAFPCFKLDRVWHDAPGVLKVTAQRLDSRAVSLLSDHLPVLIEVAKVTASAQ